MAEKTAEKSRKVLNALQESISSFQKLLGTINDDLTKQNVLRSMILFSCSGLDAIIKQLVIETLESVIERDAEAQKQLHVFVARQLKNNGDKYSLLAELLTARNSRKLLIEMLKKDLTFNSLQSIDELSRVAGYFNIKMNDLIDNCGKDDLEKVFRARNMIVHQMDVKLEREQIEYNIHDENEASGFCETIKTFACKFIEKVNEKLAGEVTEDYAPLFSVADGVIMLNF